MGRLGGLSFFFLVLGQVGGWVGGGGGGGGGGGDFFFFPCSQCVH
jgi:hypothetical protein